MNERSSIALSIIIRLVGGGKFLGRCLEALIPQTQGKAVEIIVPYDASVAGINRVAEQFPMVTWLDFGANQSNDWHNPGEIHEIYDLRTAAGLQAARGDILAIIEDYGTPTSDWCDQILNAHHLTYPVIGGAVEHTGKGVVNWAVYFLDFGRYQLPLQEGPVNYLTDVNITYKRAALISVQSCWAEAYNEVTVNWALQKQGAVLWLRPHILVRRDRGFTSGRVNLLERFYWGRIFGRKRAKELSTPKLVGYIVLSPLIPFVVIGRLVRKIFTGRRNRLQLVKAFPWVLLFAWAWSFGEIAGYWRYLWVTLSGAKKERRL